MNIGVSRRITSRQTGQIPAVRTGHGLAERIKIAVLPVIIMKQDVTERVNGCIGDRKWIGETIVVQWMRIQCRQMIDPNSIRSQAMSNFRYQRATATVANQVNRKFSQRMAAKVRDRIRLEQHITRNRRNINCADVIRAGTASHLAPIKFDDNFAGVRGSRSAVRALPLIEVIVIAVRRERDCVSGEIGAGEARIKWYAGGHSAYPAVNVSIIAVGDNRNSGREGAALDSQSESQGANATQPGVEWRSAHSELDKSRYED